jgi:hypothetical protein
VDTPGSAHSLGSVHGESGEQLFAAPERHPAESGAANAGTVSWRRELDGRRNPLACPLKPGDQSRRARTGGCGESVANCPPGDPARHRPYSGGLGLPGQLAISTSVGRWRQMSEVSLYAIPCDDRWPNNLLVSEVPGVTKKSGVAGVQELQNESAEPAALTMPIATNLERRLTNCPAILSGTTPTRRHAHTPIRFPFGGFAYVRP